MTLDGPRSYRLPALRRGGWMRIVTLIIVCVALLILFYPYLSVFQPAPSDNIPWRRSVEKGLAEAKQSGKPVFLDFSASWCPPCQEMKRISWPDPRVEQVITRNFIPVQIDGDQPDAQAASEKYDVIYIPALFILDPDGKVIRRGSFMSTDELLKFLEINTPAS